MQEPNNMLASDSHQLMISSDLMMNHLAFINVSNRNKYNHNPRVHRAGELAMAVTCVHLPSTIQHN